MWTLLGTLVFCNFLWSWNPLFGKKLLSVFSPSSLCFWKLLTAWLAFLPVFLRVSSSKKYSFFHLWKNPVFQKGILWTGGGLFAANLLGFWGLKLTTASETSLIYATEPLLATLLAAYLLQERVSSLQKIALGVATAGFLLLSLPHIHFPQSFWGNLLILFSLLGEAFFSLGSRKLAPYFPTSCAFFWGLSLATLCSAFLWLFSSPIAEDLFWIQKSFLLWRMLYIGSLGVGLSYAIWMKALEKAPISLIAPTIFLQPILGSLWGRLFLEEKLLPIQYFGASLILLALFFSFQKKEKLHLESSFS